MLYIHVVYTYYIYIHIIYIYIYVRCICKSHIQYNAHILYFILIESYIIIHYTFIRIDLALLALQFSCGAPSDA